MSERDPWEQPLYRYARILLGEDAAAREVTLAVLETVIAKPRAHGDGEALGRHLYREIRRRALERTPGTPAPAASPAESELPSDAADVAAAAGPERVEAALHGLPEPGRSALAILLLDALDADAIGRLLGLAEAELANCLHQARLGLLSALRLSGTEAAT